MFYRPFALFPNLTVAENIALIPEDEGAGLRKNCSENRRLLAKVGIASS